MKINLVKEEGNELVIQFDTGDFTISDMLADELLEDTSVEFAGSSRDHPETGKPALSIRAKKPRDALSKAIARLDKSFTELKAQLKKK